jgi:hypothetical protein
MQTKHLQRCTVAASRWPYLAVEDEFVSCCKEAPGRVFLDFLAWSEAGNGRRYHRKSIRFSGTDFLSEGKKIRHKPMPLRQPSSS